MAAVMKVLGWRASNLRCPDHEVKFHNAQGEPHRITLLQMPNGTGKTTTLSLLRAALSGSAQDSPWSREQVREFARRDSLGEPGHFEVSLLLNGKQATISMSFDFEAGKVAYQTTHGQGRKGKFDPPSDFRRFLNNDFVPFYVFDGELAQNLLNREQTHAERVIELLFQVNALRKMSLKVDDYWARKTANQKATEERGLSRRINRLEELKKRRSELLIGKNALESKLRALTTERDRQAATYEDSIAKEEGLAHRLSDARVAVTKAEADVRAQSKEVLELMTLPAALSPRIAQEIYDLKIGLDRVKLPESAAREFFEELAAEGECICGRHIDEDVRTVIRERAKHYLGSEDVSLLNSMKTAIDEAVGTSLTKSYENLEEQVERLTEIVVHAREAQNDKDEVEQEAQNSDPAVKVAKENLDRLDQEIRATKQELSKFDDPDESRVDEDTFGLTVIEGRIAEAEDKVAEIAQTLELKEKRDILKRILETAYNQARRGITDEICAEANHRISELMPHNDIRIERIDRCLHLEGRRGGSVGEQLSVAYGFLATLFERSDQHRLPFIVDSPAGSLDLMVRNKIGALVPRLSGQFIAFTISSEREGFVPSLKAASKESIQFLTLFRKGSSSLEAKARKYGAIETKDGLYVEGEEFFCDFQDEEVGA